jgi:hypothetical protein
MVESKAIGGYKGIRKSGIEMSRRMKKKTIVCHLHRFPCLYADKAL